MSQTSPPMSQKSAPERLSGVFSQRKTAKIGSGATARKTELLSYYYVEEREDGAMLVQALTASDVPFGPKTEITREELLANYLPEPQKTQAHSQAAMSPQELDVLKAVARGDKFRKRGESFTAEYEYSKALSLDERNVRANFGIGLCYIERGERDKAQEVFERVVKLDAAFEDEHKHLFNEFGISLRKSGMHAEAMDYYRRALDLSSEDENLHYNMARAAYDKGDPGLSLVYLKSCLALNPKHEEALQFVDFLKRKKASGA
ncbi:MAG: tetratricopeptide repeat protein [Humidesulfovibrio sp.]|nr:tetratricopeptide repeat protein [Humidesulfovibrio sp.]